MAKISDVKDIYIDNVAYCKKEDSMKIDPSKYIIATPTISVSTEYDVALSGDIKNIYIEQPDGVSIIPEAVLKNTALINSGQSFVFKIGFNGQLSFNQNDYLKLILYNQSDDKTPIYYELFNMNNGNWNFVESGDNSSQSQLSNYNVTLETDSSNMMTKILNPGNFNVCMKIFSSKK